MQILQLTLLTVCAKNFHFLHKCNMTILAILPKNSLLCAALGFNEKQRLRKKQSLFYASFHFSLRSIVISENGF